MSCVDAVSCLAPPGVADHWAEAPAEPPPSYNTLVDPFVSKMQDPSVTSVPSVTPDLFPTATSSVTSDLVAPSSSASGMLTLLG